MAVVEQRRGGKTREGKNRNEAQAATRCSRALLCSRLERLSLVQLWAFSFDRCLAWLLLPSQLQLPWLPCRSILSPVHHLTPHSSQPPLSNLSKDAFTIGSKCTIVHDADLRGNITIGSGTSLCCSLSSHSSSPRSTRARRLRPSSSVLHHRLQWSHHHRVQLYH